MKKRKIILIAIIIAILLIAVGTILIIVNNDNKETTKTDSNNNENTETTTEDDYINFYSDVSYIVNMADNLMIDYYPIDNFQELSSEQKTEFILRILSTDPDKKLNKENMEQEKVKYFNNNAKLTYKTFATDNFEFNYNEDNEEYEIAAKELNNYNVVSKTTNEYFDDNNNWIVERTIYFKEMTDISAMYPARVYGSIEDAKNKINEIYTINSQEEELTNDDNYNTVAALLPKYRYTLEKQNNNYKLISIEKIENQ